MIGNDFNKLEIEKRNNIYKTLLETYSETNLSYFFREEFRLFGKSVCLDNSFNQKHWELFKSFFSQENFNDKKQDLFKKIIEDISKVTKKLQFFNHQSFGFNISIGLAGGALRDLMLMENPKIKDLDLIVSFGYSEELIQKGFSGSVKDGNNDCNILKSFIKKANIFLIKNNLEPFDLMKISPDIDVGISSGKFTYHIVSQIMKNKFKITNEFFGNLKNVAPIEVLNNNFGSENRHLNGVIKIKDNHFNYDLDLLITSVPIKKYLDAFDYSICKMMLTVLDYNDKLIFENENLFDLFKKIELSPEVYQDVLEKKLTFNTDNFSCEEVERSLNNHYPRLKEKYPNYNLALISKRAIHNEDYLNSLELYINLSEKVKKDNKADLKKIKV